MNKNYQLGAIGAVIVVAIALVSWFLFSIKPTVGDGKNQIRVRFVDVEKISGGTRVTFAGRPVGEVVGIHLLPQARTEGANKGEIFPYEVDLKLDSKVSVYPTDEISLKTSGLMGERTIAITPRRLDNDAKPLEYNDIIYAASSGSVDETMASVANVTKKLEKTMDRVMDLEVQFGKTLDSITATSNEVGTLVKRANELDIAGSADALINKISTGNGTLARLISKDDFYLKMVGILNKTDTLMSDINNYGPLFHLDKGWQRERRKQIEEIARLEKPAAFQSYLNEELQKISLSVGRVNLALDKADRDLDSGSNAQLAQGFTELLSSIEALDKTLKVYVEAHNEEQKKK